MAGSHENSEIFERFPTRGLFYGKRTKALDVNCYVDSDWAGSTYDRRSTRGYCISLGGHIVIWKSKKQSVGARSSAEAEYRSMAESATDVVWVRQLLELGFQLSMPMKLWCDNQAAIDIGTNPVYHERTKHIEIDCHYIRDKVTDGTICLCHINTKVQPADIFTKALPSAQRSAIQALFDRIPLRA